MSGFDEKDLLARELQERSQEVGGHPIGIESVRRSARRIRRRRQVLTGAVAAIVLGVAVPTGLALTGGLTNGRGPVHQPPVANQGSAEPAPTPRPDGTFPLTTRNLPRGEAARLGYVVGEKRELVTPDGPVELPEAYAQVVRLRQGWLALDGGENGWENVLLDADMRVEGTTLGGPTLVVSGDGTRVLYSRRDFNAPGRTVVVDEPTEVDHEKEQMTWDAPRDSTVEAVGFLDDRTVVYQTEGEEALVTVAGYGRRSAELTAFLNAGSTSEARGLVTGQVSYDPLDGSCFGAMDPEASTTELVWRTCEHRPHEFSPDGRYVVAGAADSDGLGSPTLAVLDAATGEPLVEFSPREDVMVAVSQAAWEDEDTLLAVVHEGNGARLLRVEMSGRLEAVTAPYPNPDMTVPLWLAGTPRW